MWYGNLTPNLHPSVVSTVFGLLTGKMTRHRYLWSTLTLLCLQEIEAFLMCISRNQPGSAYIFPEPPNGYLRCELPTLSCHGPFYGFSILRNGCCPTIGKAGEFTPRQEMIQEKRRILSIDGGGIKGVIPAAFLTVVEETTGKRIVDHFDLIAGTSTGGIIAIGLGLGLSARQILDFYEQEGPRIFDQENIRDSSILSRLQRLRKNGLRRARHFLLSKYKPDALRAALESAYGDRLLGDSKTRLVIPAFDPRLGGVYVFKTSHHERFVIDWKHNAVDVALATAAAPTYFPSHKMDNGLSLLDGGIWANNPVGLAVVEALGILDWPRESLYVLSLGCSEEAFEIPENSGKTGLATKVADIFMRGQTRAAIGTAKILTKHSDKSRRLYRYNEIVPTGMYGLDSTEQIAALKGIGTNMARQALSDISSVFLDREREQFVACHGGMLLINKEKKSD